MNNKVKKIPGKKEPPGLTKAEKELMARYIVLWDWQFERTLLPHSTQLDYRIIYWEKNKKGDNVSVKATLWALTGVFDKDVTMATNFFVRYYNCVYQTLSLTEAVKILPIIEKEYKRELYEEELYAYREKQKKLKTN